ncbi:hypothetical protein U9M48_007726 [Paspalum notatum var. saurae]|uniref:Uncharacterized protein n=1 Tax=Paspalum notatum var. saurae TaxID=547442 RepID=A0AAQ3WC08_PASNO
MGKDCSTTPSQEHHAITSAAAHGSGSSKKHTRSRGRAKKAQDPFASAYGVVPFLLLRKRPWTLTQNLDETRVGEHVHLFGEVRSVLLLSNTEALVVLLDHTSTVGCVVTAGSHEGVTTRMVRFAVTLPQVTAIDVEGIVSLPEDGKPLIPHHPTGGDSGDEAPFHRGCTCSHAAVKMEENVMERTREVEKTEQSLLSPEC